MASYAVIGTSPFIDTSVVCGPYRTNETAERAARDLEHKGYVTEIAEMFRPSEIDAPDNDEGAEE